MKNFFYDFIKTHYLLNRTAVSDDTDKLVDSIRDEIECNVIEIPSGAECLTWIIPKYWNVREAYLSRLDGTRLINFKNNPLHLWTHSVSFQGEIHVDELKKHLCFDPSHPDWIPFHYKNGFKFDAEEWGFCLSYNDYLKLNDERYIVNIDTELSTKSSIKIIDSCIPGKSQDTIFLAAHTCHQGQATDGLSNIAVLIEVFKYLDSLNERRYSYRLIIGPEYFAAAGFLEKTSQDEISRMKCGIFLDRLGNNQPFGYQSSFQGDSIIDRIIQNVFGFYVPNHVTGGYRELCGNDEMFYDGCGYNIPTPGIIGAQHDEYHFDHDNLDILNVDQLKTAVEIIEKIISVFETDYVPVPLFKGPLYLSRYELYIDPKADHKGYNNLQNIQILMNGERSCFEIAWELEIDFFFVRHFCDLLYEKELLKREHINIFD
ncbi:MAG: DUF4910 domain-containing protein [Desulfobulbaceae bacterium]|nr:DUF4910 domain-containing protein [Desulfobulbaceae bacterium]